MGFDYISYRKTKRSGIYKLRKRTEKILEMVTVFKNQGALSILDVGAADGSMLNSFRDNLDTRICLGIEPSFEFIKSKSAAGCPILQAEGGKLPFRNNTFDVITAASVIDHLREPLVFLTECRRVLKKGGIIVISLVSPLYDNLAVKFLIKENDHLFRFTGQRLKEILQKENFDVLKISRFALPFFGIFLERFIERMLELIGMGWLMFYIIAVGRRKE